MPKRSHEDDAVQSLTPSEPLRRLIHQQATDRVSPLGMGLAVTLLEPGDASRHDVASVWIGNKVEEVAPYHVRTLCRQAQVHHSTMSIKVAEAELLDRVHWKLARETPAKALLEQLQANIAPVERIWAERCVYALLYTGVLGQGDWTEPLLASRHGPAGARLVNVAQHLPADVAWANNVKRAWSIPLPVVELM